jgi:hypothetical protein
MILFLRKLIGNYDFTEQLVYEENSQKIRCWRKIVNNFTVPKNFANEQRPRSNGNYTNLRLKKQVCK